MLLVVGLVGGAAQAGAEMWQPEPLPRSEEVQEALAACPEALQAGAGVVADSVPTREYDETVSKAAALGRAIDLAESLQI